MKVYLVDNSFIVFVFLRFLTVITKTVLCGPDSDRN